MCGYIMQVKCVGEVKVCARGYILWVQCVVRLMCGGRLCGQCCKPSVKIIHYLI